MLRKYFKKNLHFLILSVLLGGAGTYFILNTSLALGQLVDVATKSVEGNIKMLIFKAIAFAILGNFLSAMNFFYIYKFGDNVSLDMRVDIIKSYYTGKTTKFLANSSDLYFNLLDEDIDNLRKSYFNKLCAITSCILQAAIFAYSLYKIHYTMLIIAIVFSIVPMVAGQLVAKPVTKAQEERSDSNEDYLSKLHEILNGYELIKTSTRHENFIARFKDSIDDRTKKLRALNMLNVLGQKIIYIVALLGIILIIGFGGELVSRGIITAGLLLSALLILNEFGDSLRNAAYYFMEIKSCKPLLDKIELPDTETKAISKTQRKLDFPIDINNLAFGFKDKNLYSDINVDIDRGDLIAIVGHSGSGKSTLAKLLLKYFDDYKGDIRVGSENLKDIDEFEVYDMIHYIPQNPFILKTSLFNNIAMYNDDLKKDSQKYMDIIKKAKLEDVWNRYKDIEKLDPIKLSGGEKQRIAIARALANMNKIIIFDEPNTGLDPENAKLIDDLIFSLNDKARIVITHNWDENYLSQFDKVLKI
ncbi:MAG: ABC transporter ATP-binding protein [Tissierellia bacterium]|nr:ABC transporter ATP-binding protein [Tissierellia bacterium]